MRSSMLFAALLLLCSSALAAAVYGTNYPAATGGSTAGGTDSTLPPSLMKILVSENCSGIYVLVQSSDYMADNPPIPNASIEVDALPRANINVLAAGTTDARGVFAFNTTSDNISITATKDGYAATRTEFAPLHPSCSAPPKLAVSFTADCSLGTAIISVTADGKPAARAIVSVGGNEAGSTDASGNLSLKLAAPADLAIAYQGAVLNTTYSPGCPAAQNATAPPPTGNTSPRENGSAAQAQPPAVPQTPGEPLDLPLIGAVIVAMVIILYVLSRSLGKGGKSSIGPGPIPPANQIGPGPMKSKSQIGPGPMKKGPSEIGPGPM